MGVPFWLICIRLVGCVSVWSGGTSVVFYRQNKRREVEEDGLLL